jgi:23S rRNA pseudouridine2605 synthase
VGPGDEVRINGELVKVRFAEPRARVLMYHKPTGELVTRDDPEGRPTVFEKLPSIGNGKWINIGRLDYNTEGLLLFTNSGELANRMMHPRFEVEREYAVRVMGRLSDEQMERLTTGIDLEDGPARCDKVEDGGGDEDGANHWYKVVLREGRNREVRRLFEALGLMVSRLIRTRYGAVAMPTVLKRGDLAELEPSEVANVLNAAGLRNANAKNGQPHDPRRKGPHAQGGRGRPGQQPNRPGHPHGGGPRGQMQGQGGGRPHGRPGGKPGFNKGPRPNAPAENNANHDYDERQPLSNANASPFGRTTLTVPGGMPHGRPAGERPYGQGGRTQAHGNRRFGKGNRGPNGAHPAQVSGNHPQGPGARAQGPGGRGPGQGPRPHGNPNKRHRRGGNRPRPSESNEPEGLPRDDVARVDEES